ncbi:tetracycline-efflux transporter [Diplodia corticola]|uniref:Tetracycline-efflux transporter n=1 Tax=Diplodia corticola TaxID=236234 RepID=A0A1J9S7M4_9PEZI|nr:tetracycline-efflux transporter [Diplodia corticola]OJD35916.1 tetracycline-efflux transporter [Diplodia corticola]
MAVMTRPHRDNSTATTNNNAPTSPSADSDNVELGWLDARDDEPFLRGASPSPSSDAGRAGTGSAAAPRHAPGAEAESKLVAGGRPRPRVIWLTVFFLMNSLAFGIAVVPRVNLFVSLICRASLPPPSSSTSSPPVVVGGYNPQCQVDAVSSRTALVQSAGNVIAGVLSAGMAAFLNVLSDRVGRVRVMAYTATVLAGVEVVLVVLARSAEGTSWRWLYVAFALDGLSGSFATIMAMASAYISDCVKEEERNVQVGRMHGAMFIGIAVGPAISSAIVAGSGQKSPLLVFYLGLAMRVISLVYLMLFVAESLPQARRSLRGAFPAFSQARWQQMTKPASGIDVVLVKLNKVNPRRWLDRLVPPGNPVSRRLRRNVVLLLSINLVCYVGAMATADVLILYPQVVFKWGNVENNMFMSVINGFRAAVSTLGIPILIFFFQRRRSPPHHHPIPNPTTTTTSSALLDPSAFPDDLDALTSPTSPHYHHPDHHPDHTSPTSPTTTLDPLDRTLILTALLFDIFGYLGYAASPNGVFFTLCGAAAAFGAVGLSTSEAALTKIVAPSSGSGSGDPGRSSAEPAEGAGAGAAVDDVGERSLAGGGGGSGSRVGELMAGLGLLQSVVRVVAPAVVNVVYGATVAVGAPGTAFVGVAGVLGVGVVLAWGLRCG